MATIAQVRSELTAQLAVQPGQPIPQEAPPGFFASKGHVEGIGEPAAASFLTKEILATDGADLVLTMTREHLRHVVAMDPSAWPRTFTLKEFVRRAQSVAPATAGAGGFPRWLDRAGDGGA